jgi:hypothetical protein
VLKENDDYIELSTAISDFLSSMSVDGGWSSFFARSRKRRLFFFFFVIRLVWDDRSRFMVHLFCEFVNNESISAFWSAAIWPHL